MRFRPVKKQLGPARRKLISTPSAPQPPQMDNPYSRHYTQPRTLESLRRKKTNL